MNYDSSALETCTKMQVLVTAAHQAEDEDNRRLAHYEASLPGPRS